ncbi:hypothetical protein ACVV2G_29915 [Streptomyces ziwulingensis]
MGEPRRPVGPSLRLGAVRPPRFPVGQCPFTVRAAPGWAAEQICGEGVRDRAVV